MKIFGNKNWSNDVKKSHIVGILWLDQELKGIMQLLAFYNGVEVAELVVKSYNTNISARSPAY